MTNKNWAIAIAAILGLSLIVSSAVLGNAYRYKYKSQDEIKVKGLGTKNFEADLVVWSANFKRRSNNLKDASEQLQQDRNLIEKFLLSKGIKKNEYVFSAINSNEDYDSYYNKSTESYERTFNGYILSQTISVESKDLDKVSQISREITDLISEGVNLNSNSPDYYYTKLEDLKLQLVSDASENATKRAENIADKAGNSLGKLKKANMGVFQITGQNKNDDYTYGGTYNTKNRKKTARVTVNLVFAVD